MVESGFCVEWDFAVGEGDRRPPEGANHRRGVGAGSLQPAPAFTDLFGGQVQAFIITLSTAIGFVRAGKARALALTTATRSDVVPDLPTIGEFLPGFEASAWDGFGAPKATPAFIIDKLSSNITAGLADPQLEEVVQRLIIADAHRGARREPLGLPAAQALGVIVLDLTNDDPLPGAELGTPRHLM